MSYKNKKNSLALQDTNPFAESVVDRSVLEVAHLHDVQNDREYWISRTPDERFAAIEMLRQINYGYDETPQRFQRILEIAEFPSG